MKKIFFAAFAMAFALCFSLSVASAELQVTFEGDKFILNRGKPVLSGYFINSGDTDVKITRFVIQKIRAVNSNDYWIWSAKDVNFYPENLIVAAGERIYHSFIFSDQDAPERGQVKSNFTYIIYKEALNTHVEHNDENFDEENYPEEEYIPID